MSISIIRVTVQKFAYSDPVTFRPLQSFLYCSVKPRVLPSWPKRDQVFLTVYELQFRWHDRLPTVEKIPHALVLA